MSYPRIGMIFATTGAAAASCLAQPVRYRVEILEPTGVITVPDTPIRILAFDDANRGYGYWTREFSRRYPVVWDNGELRDLPEIPGGYEGRVTGVSPSGIVVGEMLHPLGGRSGFVVDNGQFSLLPTNSDWPVPSAVNDGGWAVGRAVGSPWPGTPHQWHNGEVSLLPVADGFPMGYAAAINASGEIVGAVAGGLGHRAARWSDGAMSLLPIDEPVSYSAAIDLNDSGWSVGTVQYIGADGPSAVLWRDGGVTVLTPASDVEHGEAAAMNGSGQVVGSAIFSVPQFSSSEGFLWQDGELYRLNELIDGPVPWVSFYADAISENGIISGHGDILESGEWRGVLLIPVPEPGTLCAVAGAVQLAARRRRSATR